MHPVLLGLLAVLLFNGYALLLILLRSRVYRVKMYRPMLINMGLSVLPVVVSSLLVGGSLLIPPVLEAIHASWAGPVVVWIYLVLVAGVWLLFFPNSAYLITELNLSHRSERDAVPLWFDIVQTLTLAVSGIVDAVVSLAVMHVTVWSIADDAAPGPPAASWVFALTVLFLGTVGMYLGRYLRFNSWDIRHPSSMIDKLRKYAATPGHPVDFLGFVATHTVLLALIYAPIFLLGMRGIGG
jgi:uncharacterized membrane protein